MKQRAIEAAKVFADNTPEHTGDVFVTTNMQVHTIAQDAVAQAVQLDAGNPIVITIEPTDIANKPDALVPLVKLTKAESIEKATKLLEEANAEVANKETALETAEPKKKGAATQALNKAKKVVETAEGALAYVKGLPDDEAAEGGDNDTVE